MIYLDPAKVLASPWLWDEKTLEWARRELAARSASRTSCE